MTDGKPFDNFIEKMTTYIEIVTLRKELTRRVLSELKQRDIKWATKFANAVLGREAHSYSEKEVQDCDAICDLFTKTYVSNMGIFDSPITPYDLWKAGELWFVRKGNVNDMQNLTDKFLSNKTMPTDIYLITVSEGELVAEKVSALKLVRTTIKKDSTAKQVEEFRAEQPYITHRPVEGETFGYTGYYNYAEAIRNLNAIATGVEPDSLAKSIVATENAREIFCHITGQPFTTFTKLSTDVIVIDRSDLPSKVKVLVEHLSNIFELSKINIDPLLLSYSLCQYYDKPDNNYIDILNTIHTIVEAANDLQKKGELK